ncbi:MAG: TetR/AcrR family transcriptional regulator [Flavobacteriales bacterium]|jgi:TetR/AcrR family transcriptional regulator
MVNNKEGKTEIDILKAAKRIFERKGMFGTRMQEIADEAGINKALLHYYYRSKQLLFEAVFTQAFGIMAPKLEAIINAELSLEEKIRSFSAKYMTFISKHPYLPNFIIQELNNNPKFLEKLVNNKKFPDFSNFNKQVLEMIEKNEIRAIDPNQLFINILCLNLFPFIGAPLLKGLTKTSDAEYQLLIEERKTQVADFIIHAIKL